MLFCFIVRLNAHFFLEMQWINQVFRLKKNNTQFLLDSESIIFVTKTNK